MDKGQNVGRTNGFPTGRMGCYNAFVGGEWGSDKIRVYIKKYDPNGIGKPRSMVFNKKTGSVDFVEYEDGTVPESLFGIANIMDADAIFVALAEALHHAGYYPEVDNRERITAQALAEERKEQVEYLKKQQEYVTQKLLNK